MLRFSAHNESTQLICNKTYKGIYFVAFAALKSLGWIQLFEHIQYFIYAIWERWSRGWRNVVTIIWSHINQTDHWLWSGHGCPNL